MDECLHGDEYEHQEVEIATDEDGKDKIEIVSGEVGGKKAKKSKSTSATPSVAHVLDKLVDLKATKQEDKVKLRIEKQKTKQMELELKLAKERRKSKARDKSKARGKSDVDVDDP